MSSLHCFAFFLEVRQVVWWTKHKCIINEALGRLWDFFFDFAQQRKVSQKVEAFRTPRDNANTEQKPAVDSIDFIDGFSPLNELLINWFSFACKLIKQNRFFSAEGLNGDERNSIDKQDNRSSNCGNNEPLDYQMTSSLKISISASRFCSCRYWWAFVDLSVKDDKWSALSNRDPADNGEDFRK